MHRPAESGLSAVCSVKHSTNSSVKSSDDQQVEKETTVQNLLQARSGVATLQTESAGCLVVSHGVHASRRTPWMWKSGWRSLNLISSDNVQNEPTQDAEHQHNPSAVQRRNGRAWRRFVFRCSATWRPFKKRYKFIHKIINSKVLKSVSSKRFQIVQMGDQVGA